MEPCMSYPEIASSQWGHSCFCIDFLCYNDHRKMWTGRSSVSALLYSHGRWEIRDGEETLSHPFHLLFHTDLFPLVHLHSALSSHIFSAPHVNLRAFFRHFKLYLILWVLVYSVTETLGWMGQWGYAASCAYRAVKMPKLHILLLLFQASCLLFLKVNPNTHCI